MAKGIEHLLCGEGHFFDLRDGLQASTSLHPVAGYPATVRLLPTSWGDFGRGVMAIPSTFAGTAIRIDAQLGHDWTVMARRVPPAGGAFVGVAQRSSGTSYVAGVESAAFGMPVAEGGEALRFRVIDGILEIVKEGTTSPEVLDDLVVLPWRAPDTMLQAWTAAASTIPKFGPLPCLRLDGDMVGGGTILAEGRVTGIDVIQRPSRFPIVGWVNNGHVVRCIFDELDERYVSEIEEEITTPTPPGSPIAWFDASNVDLIRNATMVQGQQVSTWKDAGSRAQDATQATAINRPSFHFTGTRRRANNSPAVRFVGGDVMTTVVGAPDIQGPVTVAAVFRPTDVSSGNAYVLDRASGAAFRARIFHASGVLTFGGDGTTAAMSIGAIGLDGWCMASAVLSSASSPIRQNGTEEITATNLQDSPGTGGFTIGANQIAGLNGFDGDIAEIIVWDGVQDLDIVEEYLVAKYGGAFPQ